VQARTLTLILRQIGQDLCTEGAHLVPQSWVCQGVSTCILEATSKGCAMIKLCLELLTRMHPSHHTLSGAASAINTMAETMEETVSGTEVHY